MTWDRSEEYYLSSVCRLKAYLPRLYALRKPFAAYDEKPLRQWFQKKVTINTDFPYNRYFTGNGRGLLCVCFFLFDNI